MLVSGGLDSTVALWWARAQGRDVTPLTFHYPGRPRREVEATRAVVAHAGLAASLVEAHMPFLAEGDESDARAGTRRFHGAPPGYVPARNALFYSAAWHHAQRLGCAAVAGGHHADDAESYPDASADFFRDLERLLRRGMWLGPEAPVPRLEMPLITLRPREVVALGERLGAPLHLSWSCYEDGDAPCGACPACARRILPPLRA